MRKPPPDARTDVIRKALQAMPIDKRAETIVEIFSVIAAEFAAMILEHTTVNKTKPAKRRAGKKSR